VYHPNVELLLEAQFMLQQRFDVVLCSVTGDNGALCGGGIIPDDGDDDVKSAFCRWLVPRVSSSS
jgi:hypothetical protein